MKNSEVAPTLGDLLPLLGDWSGTARITPPGRDPIQLRHTEHVALRAGGTVLTIEGTSYPAEGGDDPVFGAFAVVCVDEGADAEAPAGGSGLRWHAYNRGHHLDTSLAVTPGHFSWEQPGEPRTRYHADFDHARWLEVGRLILPGEPVIFTMELDRVPES